jgi:NitT/TauT family transport system substrate-binding protein
MATKRLPRNFAIALVATGAWIGSLAPTLAADKVTFLTSWFAQAEHGGFYQAKATGLYEKAGLDVTIKTGGPQVNSQQLLLAGETDFMMGYDIQVMKAREQNVPLVTVASSFQFDLQGLMAHEDVTDIAALKGHPVLIAGSSRTTFWPWLRARYGFTDDQIRPYTFNLQPFFADKTMAQQGYLSSEPFAAAQHSSCSPTVAIRPMDRPSSPPRRWSRTSPMWWRASSRRRWKDGATTSRIRPRAMP